TRDATRDLARGAGETFERNVVPVVGSALGSVLSVVDVAKDARIAAALRRAGFEAPAAKKAKSGPGFCTFLAITAGVIAAAG
ncbi:hypothetical protein ACC691_40580, partial [Rhizobium johnstonii]|uniref:hypothetical protein n=1 Tax=Rhizobium johnstonii TaxID=3019933 RepID=UPI003F9B35C5